LDQQSRFVAWWGQTVHRKGGKRWIDNPERGYQVCDVEHDSGISQQQVSRWNKSLEQPDQYREKLRRRRIARLPHQPIVAERG
jgi:hypothetical protein